MGRLKYFQRFAIALILALAIAFVFAASNALRTIVSEQSRLQQQALSPVYKLVRDELIRPLYIAETFASSARFMSLMESANLDEQALTTQLQAMQRDLDLVFFVASERARKQYFSNRGPLDLEEGKVAWYFEAQAQDRDFFADLGQVGDVHLFYDVKIYGEERAFLGYVGVGKSIKRFLETFDLYKAQYGYDFLFVNEDNEVILSSLADLVVTDEFIPKLDSVGLPDSASPTRASLDSQLIEVNSEDYLISEIAIEELDWRLLLLVPLKARQAQIIRSFATSTFTSVVLVILLIGASLYLLMLYKISLEKKTEIDLLSGLPNRRFLQRRFGQLRRSNTQLSVVIADLDFFKNINDSYGHEVGDQVIKAAANGLKESLREMDIVGRWGGEEFVMLIPASSIDMAQSIAERARSKLERMNIDTPTGSVSVTASFGVAFGSAASESLSDLLARADNALYEAKNNGRNQVRLALAD
ncbi:MAG: diguanylate cyclase [Pseudomonadota bacterium]